MRNKNVNNAPINTDGGNVHFGDQYFNDLSIAYNQVYKERVSEIEKQLHSFKPQTARELLEQLECDISQKEKIEDVIKGKISFLKAICDEFLDVKADELSVSFLKAYSLNKSDINLKVIASLQYFVLSELDKAKELVDEILSIEEYSPIAWAVKALMNPSTSLSSVLNDVPEFVRKKISFRRTIYFHSKRKKTYEDLETAFPEFQILMNIDDFDKTPLSFKNYKDRLFLIESLLSTYSQSIWISFNKQVIENTTELKRVHDVLCSFINEIAETEILSNHISIQFFAAYLHYQLNSDVHSVNVMLRCYEKMPEKQLLLLLLTTNSLQQIDELDKAIELIEQQEEKDPISIDLMMFCQIKKNNGAAYLRCVREYLSKVKTINKQNTNNYFIIPQTLNDFGLLNEIHISEFVENKLFEPQEGKDFLILFVELLKGEIKDGITEDLDKLYNNLSKSEEALLVFFATSFYLLGNHEKCCEIYEKYVRTDIETLDLHSYILSLYRSKNRHKELLPLLLHWRTNFSFQKQLIRLEIELRRHLFQWEVVINCCEYLFKNQEITEFELINYAIAINESDIPDKDKKIRLLLSYLEKTTIKNYSSYSTIITVIERSNFQDKALDLLFSKAQEKSNSQARMEYFNFTSFREQKYLERYNEIKEGVFLKFKMNGIVVYDELTEGNEYLEYLIGKKEGDEIVIPGKFGGQGNTITILRIMNKYLSLYDEILEEVHSNPFSKIPMQSFNMKEYIDGEKSIIDFFQEFGGKKDPQQLDENFRKYYNHELTFSELIYGEFSMNYLKAYYTLIKDKNGLTQINPLQLGISSLQKYDEFILDFTSLLHFFELNKAIGITFDIKFTITSSTVSLIKTYSTEFPPISGKEYILDPSYFKELLVWIRENCQTKMPISKLDAIAMAKEPQKRTITEEYGLDNSCLLLDNENALLITDDLFYFKLFPVNSGKIISTWLFSYLSKVSIE